LLAQLSSPVVRCLAGVLYNAEVPRKVSA
jgi:hypothetical protein